MLMFWLINRNSFNAELILHLMSEATDTESSQLH